jgi:hypothetical protein
MSTTCFGNMSRAVDVNGPSLLAIAFRIVDASNGSSVCDDIRSNLVEQPVNSIRVRDIEGIERDYRVTRVSLSVICSNHIDIGRYRK